MWSICWDSTLDKRRETGADAISITQEEIMSFAAKRDYQRTSNIAGG